MALDEKDVKVGIGGMMLEIWALQKRVAELQAELAALQEQLAPKKKDKT